MKNILFLDIGSGTQDVLYYREGIELENCPRFVLPTPAKNLAKQIRACAEKKQDIYLFGRNAGGGFWGAINEHLEKNLKVFVHPQAAFALSDNFERLAQKNIIITEKRPENTIALEVMDFSMGFWQSLLAMAGLEYPEQVVAAAQDHGYHEGKSNRVGRFILWKSLLFEHAGKAEALLYKDIPKEFTRLQALASSIGNSYVCDTGIAAVLGALSIDKIAKLSHERGITLINIGNSHTLCFLLYKEKILGVYEHHTGLLDAEKLWEHKNRFAQGNLSFEEIFDDNGHGALTLELPKEAQGFSPCFVLGPKRNMLIDYDVEFIAPAGDMMLAGAFGMAYGLKKRKDL